MRGHNSKFIVPIKQKSHHSLSPLLGIIQLLLSSVCSVLSFVSLLLRRYDVKRKPQGPKYRIGWFRNFAYLFNDGKRLKLILLQLTHKYVELHMHLQNIPAQNIMVIKHYVE